MIKDFLLENNVALNEMFSFGKDDNFLIPILIFKKTTKIYFGSKVTNDEIKSFVNYFNFVKTDKLDLNEFNRNLANYNNHKVNRNIFQNIFFLFFKFNSKYLWYILNKDI